MHGLEKNELRHSVASQPSNVSRACALSPGVLGRQAPRCGCIENLPINRVTHRCDGPASRRSLELDHQFNLRPIWLRNWRTGTVRLRAQSRQYCYTAPLSHSGNIAIVGLWSHRPADGASPPDSSIQRRQRGGPKERGGCQPDPKREQSTQWTDRLPTMSKRRQLAHRRD